MSDAEFFAAWAETLDLLATRLAAMTFAPDSLSITESDLARLGAQAGRAVLEVVVQAGGGLPQPTMTGAIEHTSGCINVTMTPDDPKLYQQWVERVPQPFLSVVCCWGSNFRGLTPKGREVGRLQQFWALAGMVILAARLPERFASVSPGVRDFPRCEPTGRDDDGQLTFTSETERMTLAERAAWRRSQASDWAEACRAVARAVRQLAEAKAPPSKPAVAPPTLVDYRPGALEDNLQSQCGQTDEASSDPLQAIRADLECRKSDEATQVDLLARREHLDKRFENRLKDLVKLAGNALARDEQSRSETFFFDHARALLSFNEVLRECDREYPRYRILERLRKAAHAGVPALDTAASLLLKDPSANVEQLADDLERIQGSQPHDVWPMWLTYVLDHLLNSHRPPPERGNVPPDTTREEWRKAETAFGCILFADDVFAVMQDSIDQGGGLVEDSLMCGGYGALNRPPGRVRHLLAYFDARALHWYGSKSLSLKLVQPPPSIDAITEPVSLRRKMDEVWSAATYLRIALEKWTAWFVELRQEGDAHPAIALNCSEAASRAIAVLSTHRPNVAPFNQASEAELLAMLPPIPDWVTPGSDASPGHDGEAEKARTRWQDQRKFLDKYYAAPEMRCQRIAQLRGATEQLIQMLGSFPVAALAISSSPGRSGLATGTVEGRRPVPTIGVITALPHETAAILAIFGEPQRIDVPGSGAGRAYWMAELQSPLGGMHRVVIAQADMGNNLAALRAGLLLSHFPRVDVIMCGIAGGIPSPARPAEHVRLGDIVVSNQKGVVQYDFVKRKVGRRTTEVTEEQRASPHRPSAHLLEAVRIMEAYDHLGQCPWEAHIERGLDRLRWTRPNPSTDVLIEASKSGKYLPHPDDGQRRPGQPRIFLGPIASANTLLKDPVRRDALRTQYGAKAVEMEGSGVQDATWTHGVGYLVVRGVCDYCDSNKNDLWQRYAAVAAAAYVRALLESMPGTA